MSNFAAARAKAVPRGGSEDAASVFGDSLDSILTTVKWIVSSAAVVLGVLVAGLQLTHIGELTSDRLFAAMTAYLVAVFAVGTILVRAARVLVKPGLTVSDLALRELRARTRAVDAAKGDLARVQPASTQDPLLAAIARSRRELLPGAPSDLDLQAFYRAHVIMTEAWQKVSSGGTATVDGISYRGSQPSEVAALRARLDESLARADKLIDAAHLYLAQGEYRRLLRWLVVTGVVVTLAVPAFALANYRDQAEEGTKVAFPIATTVLMQGTPKDLRKTGLPPACRQGEVSGTAVGGTYAKPLVIITAPATCRGARLLVTPKVGVAVPSWAS